jgi:phage gpG-like protein
MSTIPEVSGRLREMKLKARPATTAAALAMGLLFTAEVKADELSRFTHGPLSWGESTNSPPGSPPALVSGALRGSVRPEPPVSSGTRCVVVVGGTVVYARIQELGGWAGRGHRSHLPPRPYLKPAAERLIANGSITKAAVRGWLAVMGL